MKWFANVYGRFLQSRSHEPREIQSADLRAHIAYVKMMPTNISLKYHEIYTVLHCKCMLGLRHYPIIIVYLWNLEVPERIRIFHRSGQKSVNFVNS